MAVELDAVVVVFHPIVLALGLLEPPVVNDGAILQGLPRRLPWAETAEPVVVGENNEVGLGPLLVILGRHEPLGHLLDVGRSVRPTRAHAVQLCIYKDVVRLLGGADGVLSLGQEPTQVILDRIRSMFKAMFPVVSRWICDGHDVAGNGLDVHLGCSPLNTRPVGEGEGHDREGPDSQAPHLTPSRTAPRFRRTDPVQSQPPRLWSAALEG
mmetsp:Transcript_6362/g.21902  ORF Transcript_6362/g.21902 Transcript_6362/m.21902 type:complete len:211 (-) Transcript_6362:30-662(-)